MVGSSAGSATVSSIQVLRHKSSQRYLPNIRADRPLDLGSIGADRRCREVHPLALLEPLVQ
jgi:hypothetical protein